MRFVPIARLPDWSATLLVPLAALAAAAAASSLAAAAARPSSWHLEFRRQLDPHLASSSARAAVSSASVGGAAPCVRPVSSCSSSSSSAAASAAAGTGSGAGAAERSRTPARGGDVLDAELPMSACTCSAIVPSRRVDASVRRRHRLGERQARDAAPRDLGDLLGHGERCGRGRRRRRVVGALTATATARTCGRLLLILLLERLWCNVVDP